MEDMSAALALADHVSAEPALIASLVSFAAEHQAFEAFQYLLNQGPLTSDSINAMHLNGPVSFRAALHRSMRMETVFGTSLFTMPDTSAALTAAAIGGPRDYIISDAAAPYRVFLWGKDVAAYLRSMRRYERLAAQPYYENVHEWRNPPQETASKGKGGLLAAIFIPSISRSAEHAARADAQHRLLVLAGAIWQYRLAEGSSPADLDRLVPKYLLKVPVDPFTGKSMKIAKTEGPLTIYSVGADLKDDGGKPLDRKTMQGDISLMLGR